MSKYAIELNNINEVKDFTEAVSKVESDVRLIGKDENGRDWELSAKSLLCSLLMSAKLQRNREHTAHDVDWNTLWCVCDEDIYSLSYIFKLIENTFRYSPAHIDMMFAKSNKVIINKEKKSSCNQSWRRLFRYLSISCWNPIFV